MSKLKIYITLFVLLIVVLFALEANKPKPIDWSPSFNQEHKKPWGSYVLYQELANLFPDTKIVAVEKSAYEELVNSYINIDENKSAYVFINDKLDIDKESILKLLDFTNSGNTVFMASNAFPEYLKDTLKFEIERKYFYNYKDTIKNELYFSNKNLKPSDKYLFNKGFATYHFNELNKEETTVLGYHNLEEKEFIDFVKINYGKGAFYINLQPFAFTNYNMLKDNHANYVASAFSYLETDILYWDNHNKSGIEYIDSELRFILSKPALRWAWRLIWIGLILFIIFKAKRKQRIIPIIVKPKNTSVAFAKTIGNLYYDNGEPKDIITKKITFFLEYIRNTYLLDTQNLNEDFKKRLHQKTGIPKDEINRLVNYLVNLNNSAAIKEHSLVTLNKLIDKFYKKTKL